MRHLKRKNRLLWGEEPVIQPYQEFLEYIDLTDNEFMTYCDKFRSPHLWDNSKNSDWELKHTVY